MNTSSTRTFKKSPSRIRTKFETETKTKTKTFTGCWTCRERHRKCDLRKPFCYVCERDSVKCLGFTIRLCWNHSKSDNLRRTVIYDHTLYDHMVKTNQELDSVLSDIDDIQSGGEKHSPPFSVFKLRRKVSAQFLIDTWSKEIFPRFFTPLDAGNISGIYLEYVNENISQKRFDESNQKSLLRQSIIATSMFYLSKKPKGYAILSSTIEQLNNNQILPSHLNDKCILLTTVCNCMFLLSLYINDMPPLHNVKIYLKISIRLLNDINLFCRDKSNTEGENINLINQIKILNHIVLHFIIMAYTIDSNSVTLPTYLLKDYDAEENLEDSNFFFPTYCFSFLTDFLVTASKKSITKFIFKTNNSLDIRMSIFRLEDILLRKEKKLFYPKTSNSPQMNILFHQSYLFYSAIYVLFLDNCFPPESVTKSIESVAECTIEHIEVLIKYYNMNDYSPGCLWSLFIIGRRTKYKLNQEPIMNLLKTLSKFHLEQVTLVMDKLTKIWNENVEDSDSINYENLGFLL